jgi:hypothetical protein
MEQKVKDKIDKADVIINDKIDEFNINAEAIKNDVFTEELREMLDTICEQTGRYKFKLSDVYWFEYDGKDWIRVCSCRYSAMRFEFVADKIKGYDYTNEIIESLKYYSQSLSQQNEALCLFNNSIEDIITDITAKYKEITEKQSDALDNILASLDTEYVPYKHIKVTVEWV